MKLKHLQFSLILGFAVLVFGAFEANAQASSMYRQITRVARVAGPVGVVLQAPQAIRDVRSIYQTVRNPPRATAPTGRWINGRFVPDTSARYYGTYNVPNNNRSRLY